MPRLLALVCLVAALAPGAAAAASRNGGSTAGQAATTPESRLRAGLSAAFRTAGAASGAYVANATEDRTIFERRADTPRILASNTKIFTAAAALARFGTAARLATEVLGRGELAGDGTFRGDLFLRGGGDPSFGSRTFVRRRYGGGADVESLAEALRRIGVRRVTGRVLGDESIFDSRRGGPGSGYAASIHVGPLSGLAFNRGLARTSGTAFQANPPAFAAAGLDAALERRGVRVSGRPRAGRTPRGAERLAAVRSQTMARLMQIQNKRSDNFFAEMTLKGLAALAGGRGTTAAGARLAAGFSRRLGARASLVDGSGLSRGNRASPRHVARILDRLRARSGFAAFFASLPIAGRDGTLAGRMRRGAARGRCRAKTGTLSNVSALSGYCRSRGGDTIVFSLLMNGAYVPSARRVQDRMAQAMAAYDG